MASEEDKAMKKTGTKRAIRMDNDIFLLLLTYGLIPVGKRDEWHIGTEPHAADPKM